MCKDCGCKEGLKLKRHKQDHEHGHKHVHLHNHDHDHDHKHEHHQDHGRRIVLEKNVLAHNDEIAHNNKHWFEDHNIKVINIISSPGSGKTTLLEKTVEILKEKTKLSILVGDQETDHDAQRLLNKGANVKQINTYSSCHLDAQMIAKELGGFISGEEKLLIIENIGILVCPAAFVLGEDHKVAILSTTEGEDKPVKYPVLFNEASVVLITKMDLAPHLDWDLEKTKVYIRQVNPKAKIIELSAKSGQGLDEWANWLLSI